MNHRNRFTSQSISITSAESKSSTKRQQIVIISLSLPLCRFTAASGFQGVRERERDRLNKQNHLYSYLRWNSLWIVNLRHTVQALWLETNWTEAATFHHPRNSSAKAECVRISIRCQTVPIVCHVLPVDGRNNNEKRNDNVMNVTNARTSEWE